MRAEITANGRLKVIPESELEEYALNKWWEAMSKDGKGLSSETFQVCVPDPADCEERHDG